MSAPEPAPEPEPPATSPPRSLAGLCALGCALAGVSLSLGASFDLDGFDSAEFALVAVRAGWAHPPGHPTHTLLGWLLTRLPGAPLVWLTMLSIAPLAVALVLSLARAPKARHVGPWLATLALLTALPRVREVSTRVEVYALATALATAAIALQSAARAHAPRWTALSGLLWGLAGATNPIVALQASAALWSPERSPEAPHVTAITRWRTRGWLVLTAALGCALSYSYALSAQHRTRATLVWDAPRDLASLIRVITARDFAVNVSVSASDFINHFIVLTGSLLADGTLPWVLVGALALRYTARTHTPALRGSGPTLFALVVGMAMLAANHPLRLNNPDFGGYLLLPVVLAAPGIASLAQTLGARIQNPRAPARLWSLTVLAGLALAFVQGRPSGLVRRLAHRALTSAPQRALVLASYDHLLFPMLYLQQVEGVRTDVLLLNPGWASSGWAWDWASAQAPSLRIDRTPGLGRTRRLRLALDSRDASQAVLAETPAMLSQWVQGAICPRATLWSSHEGCSAQTQSTAETARWIRDERARATPPFRMDSRWDLRVLRVTAADLGDGALGLGCPGTAARIYAAALALPAPDWAQRGCGAQPSLHHPALDLLSIEDRDLYTRLDRAKTLRQAAPPSASTR